MIPLVYHPSYNITAFGLERLHPFDSREYRRIHDALVARGLQHRRGLVQPRLANPGHLLKVHAEEIHGRYEARKFLPAPRKLTSPETPNPGLGSDYPSASRARRWRGGRRTVRPIHDFR